MDSLANYGSDDDYEENSNEKMGTYKSSQCPFWNTEADVNYDEVQMELSEESNNNNSAEDDSSPRPNKASDRKRSYRSKSRDDSRPKGHEYKSSRHRRDRSEDRECHLKNDERDRTRKYVSKGSSNHEERPERSKYDREGQSGYEDRADRSKYNRDGPSHSEDRSKYNRENQGQLEDRSERSDRSKYNKDDKNNKNRDDRNKKYRPGSKERKRSSSRDRRRSTSREKRRSGSRERKRSRSPRRNDHKRRSNSKERDRGSSSRGYGKRFDRTSNKMAQLEKLGIEIKTPDAEFVTPQMLLQRSMDEQVQKIKNSTGIELPKYYNPAAMNPARYADQIQKRRLLWQKKKDPETRVVATTVGVAGSKVWEQTTFAQDQDGKVASKFKRLMGIKENPTSTAAGGGKDILKKQEEMFSSMEQQYEVARTATHTMRGVGLGFGTYQNYPR